MGSPMSKGTDRHTIRITPDLWQAASAVAWENGETVSDVMRRALVEYVRKAPAITKALAAERLSQ